MTATDPAMTALSQSWCALSLLHGRIEAHIERALRAYHGLSVREYSLLDVLSRQHDGEGGHLQMKQVAEAVVLSHSATTRLVTRLEDRGCSPGTSAPPTGAASTPTSRPPAALLPNRPVPPMSRPCAPLSTGRRPTPSWRRSSARSEQRRPCRQRRRPSPPAFNFRPAGITAPLG